MQQGISVLALTVIATAQLTGRRFVTTAGAMGTAGAAALGVGRGDAAIGSSVAVDVLGTAPVEAGAAIAANAFVMVGANGKAVTYVGSAGNVRVGQVVPGDSAAGDGSIVEILLFPGQVAA
jgi:hypothetical protein